MVEDTCDDLLEIADKKIDLIARATKAALYGNQELDASSLVVKA